MFANCGEVMWNSLPFPTEPQTRTTWDSRVPDRVNACTSQAHMVHLQGTQRLYDVNFQGTCLYGF